MPASKRDGIVWQQRSKAVHILSAVPGSRSFC